MEIEKQIEKFERETGKKLSIRDGKPCYGGSLDLDGTAITSLPDGLVVAGSLDLRGCTSLTSLPEGLAVGGSLDLRGCTSLTSLPDGLVVADYLDLRGTGITSLPEGLAVGGYLDLRGTGITEASHVRHKLSIAQRARINAAKNRIFEWETDSRKYIKADGVFSQVVSHHGKVWHVRSIGREKLQYLVTDGEGHYAHGDTLQEAKADLIYKINDRDTSAYKGMNIDTELTFAELVAMYRTITGACAAGTRDFVENRLPKPHKETYTIREMLELTRGEYGSEKIRDFFKSSTKTDNNTSS